MTRRRYSFFIEDEHLIGLKKLKEQTLAPESAMIRQAIAEYLERRGVTTPKGERKRVAARRRS